MEEYAGFERRYQRRRDHAERRMLMRWEPTKEDRRATVGRRKVDRMGLLRH